MAIFPIWKHTTDNLKKKSFFFTAANYLLLAIVGYKIISRDFFLIEEFSIKRT